MTYRRSLLVAVIALLPAALAPAAEPSSASTQPSQVDREDQPISAPQGLADEQDVEKGTLGGSNAKKDDGWGRILAAMALVAALIVIAGFLLRRAGRASPLRGGSEVLKVIARTNLSPKERLHLVRLGGRLVLVGSAPGGLAVLSEVSDPQEVSSILAAGGLAGPGRCENASAEKNASSLSSEKHQQ